MTSNQAMRFITPPRKTTPLDPNFAPSRKSFTPLNPSDISSEGTNFDCPPPLPLLRCVATCRCKPCRRGNLICSTTPQPGDILCESCINNSHDNSPSSSSSEED
jgi:hypothetical protein